MPDQKPLKILVLTGLTEDYERLEQGIQETGIGVEGIFYAKSIKILKAKWKDISFNLIFFDPERSGCEKARGYITIRKLFPRVPVIVIADEYDPDLAGKSFKFQAEDYLVKGNYHKSSLYKVMKNIIERDSLREDLRKSVERYELVMKHCDYALVEWTNMNERVRYWNDGMSRIFGYKSGNRQKSLLWWYEKIHPDDVDEVFKSWQDCISNNSPLLYLEYRLRCADGRYKFVRARGNVSYASENKPSGVLWALHAVNDVSEDYKTKGKTTDEQRLAEFIIQAHEREREELSNKMLDNINQVLIVSKMYIEVAINKEHPTSELLKKSHGYLTRTIGEINDLSRKLLPPRLHEIGLKEAVTDIIHNDSFLQNIKFNFTYDGIENSDISYNKQLLIYRIIQEQVNNISKHANATEAKINISTYDKFIHLIISDNGTGFNPQEELNGKAFRNIIGRTNYYKGSINILNEVDEGNTLNVTIPI